MLLLLCLALSGFSLGQTLKSFESHTTESLRGVSAVSATVAWASGTHGTYLRTIDGGASWSSAQVPGAEKLDFRDVEAFSADEAYLLAAGTGELSRIYKTSNGGKEWTLQFTNSEPQGFYDCFAFWDRTHGIAVGDPVRGQFEVLMTSDGGAHWALPAGLSLPPAVSGEGAFAASGTCIAVQDANDVWFATGGPVARVFRSHDRGKTWQVADTPLVHGNASSGIFSIAFRDAQHGVIAGGDYQHPDADGPNLAVTDDGGATWKLVAIHPQFFFSAVGFFQAPDQFDVLLLGPAGAVEADLAKPSPAPRVTHANLNALSFFGPEDAIGVGAKGVIVRLSRQR